MKISIPDTFRAHIGGEWVTYSRQPQAVENTAENHAVEHLKRELHEARQQRDALERRYGGLELAAKELSNALADVLEGRKEGGS